MMQWVTADQVFDGARLLTDHAVCIAGDQVIDLKPTKDVPKVDVVTHHKGLITPGFFDIQVNGGGGVLLNTTPTPAGIETIAAAHRSFGTVAVLPTVITDAPNVLEAAVEAAIAAKNSPGVIGLHIEGPHIAVSRRGTHAERHIRPLDDHTLKLVRELRNAGLATLITVAPESATPVQVKALHDLGAVVSIGHSDATAADTMALVAAGASCFTHLFNAMSPMLNRAPGVTGAAIAGDAWCSIIADGIHVDPMMVALAIRARPKAHRMIAVSDAMSTVGGPTQFDLYGQSIQLQNGRLVNAEGSLAGAHLTLLEALQNLVTYGVDLETALRMCRSNPFDAMGLTAQSGIIGLPIADVLLLDANLQLNQVGLTAALTPSEAV
jgi:N-acetylglucosamine-6-phosphate deacetylase